MEQRKESFADLPGVPLLSPDTLRELRKESGGILDASLDAIATEMRELQACLEEIASKHRELHEELARARLENARLAKENDLLRSSRHALLAGIILPNGGDEPPPQPGEVN